MADSCASLLRKGIKSVRSLPLSVRMGNEPTCGKESRMSISL